ncbi:hypothetical protein LINPERHAP2_LOCUS32179 [Linum perenne]
MMMNTHHYHYQSFLLLLLLPFLFPLLCRSSTTILVDGVSPWNNPSLFVGDSVIFKHEYGYNLYIFQSYRAFDLCNFTQATLLTKQNNSSAASSYSVISSNTLFMEFFTYRVISSNSFCAFLISSRDLLFFFWIPLFYPQWHTSRPGFFYFAFSNGSSASSCDHYSQKLAIKVSPAPAPESSPTPVSGGGVTASPAYPWPFQPREKSASAAWAPSPEPSAGGEGGYKGASAPMKVPKVLPEKGGGMPFINSNPAVPLPNGEVDSATIRPMPTSADASGGCYNQMKRKGMVLIFLTWLSMVMRIE